MFKKILCLALALVCIAGMAVIGVSAGADTTIYFEVPSDWKDYKGIFCHIWELGGSDALAGWQSKKEKCTQVEGNLYSYDISKVGGLKEGANYGVIFSENSAKQMQTYDALMTTACYGDTLYCDGTLYENPADSSKTAIAAFWKNQDKTQYGPIMQVTSVGNLIGTCLPPSTTTADLFTSFLTGNLENAREYSGKTDQQLVDDIIAGLGLTNAEADALIKAAGVTVDWTYTADTTEPTDAPEVPTTTETPVVPTTQAPATTEAPATQAPATQAPATTDAPEATDATEAPVATDAPVADDATVDEATPDEQPDAEGNKDDESANPNDTVTTGVATTIYVVLAVVAMAAAAAFVLRKRVNG